MKHAQLIELGACIEGREFADRFNTLNDAWQQCVEPAWMIWYLRRSKLGTKEQFVRIAVFAAEKVLPIFERRYPEDSRPRKAIASAQAWINDPSATIAAYAAAAYAAADAAAAAAAYAAYAAADAAAAYAAYAAYAAADAAAAAATYADAAYADAAAAAAAAAARSKIKTEICDFIRQLIPTI